MSKRSLLAVALLGLALVAASASAQSGGTLAKIKAAKAINVAYSPDSLPFSSKTASESSLHSRSRLSASATGSIVPKSA